MAKGENGLLKAVDSSIILALPMSRANLRETLCCRMLWFRRVFYHVTEWRFW